MILAGRGKLWVAVAAAAWLVAAVVAVPQPAGARTVGSRPAGNLGTWIVQHPQIPVGADWIDLFGVSCASATACTAVGSYQTATGGGTLVESWNGAAWAIVPTPKPPGNGGSLLALSCTSATACTAVGVSHEGNFSFSLAERWNGKTWTVQPTARLPWGVNSELDAVSCPTSTVCTAVGSAWSNHWSFTLAERWNGTTWTVQHTPNPPGQLLGVSCTSSTACTAVGSYVDPTGSTKTLGEAWDGTSWQIQQTPNQSGSNPSGLSGVSCTSNSACIAVGGLTATGAQAAAPLAEAWNGTTWTILPAPAGTAVDSVSCTSATACTAVGSAVAAYVGPFAEAWNGTTWTAQPMPTGPKSGLLSVSCVIGRCTAVSQQSIITRTP
jgi:hypothetical protein